MPIIVVCNVFQERLAFYGKCLLSSFVMGFKNVWHFTRNAYFCRLKCVSRAYGILREMPIIVVCNVFQERLAFYGKCLLSSFVMGFKNVWHFTRNAYFCRLKCVSRAYGILREIAYYRRL